MIEYKPSFRKISGKIVARMDGSGTYKMDTDGYCLDTKPYLFCHRSPDNDKRWNVTHTISGLRILHNLKSRKIALKHMSLLLEYDIPWEQDAEAVARHAEAANICRRHQKQAELEV